MAREEHVQAVGFAGLQVEELETLITGVMDRVSEVRRIAVNAVGEEPTSESGKSALASIYSIRVSLAEALGSCEAAKRYLNNYGRGI